MTSRTRWLTRDERDLLAKLRPPIDIRRSLLPLNGICTYELLESLRFGMYERVEWDAENVSESITEWFENLHAVTSEWGSRGKDEASRVRENLRIMKACSDQWSSIGQELLALDRATRVSRDAPEMQKIYTAVKSIPEWVAMKVKTKYPHVDVEVMPIGSFPCNTKVIDVNEFDFLLIIDIHHLSDMGVQFSSTFNDTVGVVVFQKGYNDIYAYANSVIEELACALLDRPLQVKKNIFDNEPSFAGWNKHGPAQCLELGWRCSESHYHHIDIDITVAKRENLKPFKPMCASLQGKPAFRRIYEAMDDDMKPVKVDGKYSTCILERALHDAMEAVSPNTTSTFRLLKVLTHYLVPSRIAQQPFSPAGHTLVSPISSHKLKQAVLNHVDSHPHPHQWAVQTFHLRLVELLRLIEVGRIDQNDALLVLPPTIDSTIEDNGMTSLASNVKQHLERFIIDKSLGVYQKSMEVLGVLLLTAYPAPQNTNSSHHHSFPPHHHEIEVVSKLPRRVEYLVEDNGQFQLIDSTPRKLCNVGVFKDSVLKLVYSLSKPPMLYSTHPLIEWCNLYVHSLYESNPGADLSLIPVSIFSDAWMLQQSGFLSAGEIKNEGMLKYKVVQLRQCIALTLGMELDRAELLSLYCLMGLKQIKLIEVIIEDGTLQFTDPIWDPLTKIRETLPRMKARDRAFIRQWCHLVIETKDNIIGRDDSQLCCSEDDVHRHTIIRSVEYIMVLLQRYGSKYNDINMLGQSLLHSVVCHMMRDDPLYFECVRGEHEMWAKEFIRELTKPVIRLSSLEDVYQRPWLHWNDQSSADSRSWMTLSIERGGRYALQRCIVAYGLGISQRTQRSGSGMILSLADEMLEWPLAVGLGTSMQNVWHDNMDAIKSGKPSAASSYQSSLSWVLFEELSPAGYAGYVRMASVAYLLKIQLHLYIDSPDSDVEVESKVHVHILAETIRTQLQGTSALEEDFAQQHMCEDPKYKLIARIPRTAYANRAPISLLWRPDEPGVPGYFSLMLKRDHVLFSDLWNITDDISRNAVFDNFVSKAGAHANSVEFEHLLTPQEMTRSSMFNY